MGLMNCIYCLHVSFKHTSIAGEMNLSVKTTSSDSIDKHYTYTTPVIGRTKVNHPIIHKQKLTTFIFDFFKS